MEDFGRLKMKESETIDEFSGKHAELSSKLSALGEDIEESKLVKNFLSSLPRKKYIHIIAALEQVLNLNTTTFEDIVSRLKAYEERIQDSDQEEEQGKLMYTTWIHKVKIRRAATVEAEDVTTTIEEGGVVDIISVTGDRGEMRLKSYVIGVIKQSIMFTIALIVYLNSKKHRRMKTKAHEKQRS